MRLFEHLWVSLHEDKCIGQNFHKLRDFCRERELSVSRHGHSVTWQHEYYQVFMLLKRPTLKFSRTSLAANQCILRRKGTARTGHVGRRGHTIQNLEVHELVD